MTEHELLKTFGVLEERMYKRIRDLEDSVASITGIVYERRNMTLSEILKRHGLTYDEYEALQESINVWAKRVSK